MNTWKLGGLLALAVCAGCTDPKAPNEGNFAKAVQVYLDQAYPKCYVAANFPFETGRGPMNIDNALKALEKAGLLSETKTTRKGRPYTDQEITVSVYDLTGEGKKYYRPDAVSGFGGKSGGFCIGKARVVSVDQFTEPAANPWAGGITLSEVTYSYAVSDLPVWAKDAAVLAAVPGLKEDVESERTPRQERESFGLTNTGWVHEKVYRKLEGPPK